ncbi:MAG TPA: hypothetical protein VFB96_07140, partial [Pirellulaceae bacterium]|nr:hypothetical protein [Pirellulaceae bacterium]
MKRLAPICCLELIVATTVAAAGCHQDMRDQPRYEALEASDFFADGQSARLPVAGTVARGQLQEDEAFYSGRSQGK